MKYFVKLIRKLIWKRWLPRLNLFFQDFDRNPPVLVYQMGKVGSEAVCESIKRSAIPNQVYHVHFLSYDNLDDVEKYHKSVGAMDALTPVRFWRALRRKLDRTKSKVYLISLVREPVAREISDVFQNMTTHHRQLLSNDGTVDVEKAVGYIATLFTGFNEEADYAGTWFQKEVMVTYGIDVYGKPFDHVRGFSIFENDRAKLLLLRMEDLSAVFTDAMKEFMGISVPLLSKNEASSKGYYDAYKATLMKITQQNADVTRVYNSRYAKHFYPDDVRMKLMNKWMPGTPMEAK